MYRDSGAWNVLMERLAEATAAYLNAQAVAGAQALQLFDSWVGTLSPNDYRRFVQPHMAQVYSTGSINRSPSFTSEPARPRCSSYSATLAARSSDSIGMLSSIKPGRTLVTMSASKGISIPSSSLPLAKRSNARLERILAQADGRPGHIFNLGHGILPQTPVDNVRALIDIVHASSRSR